MKQALKIVIVVLYMVPYQCICMSVLRKENMSLIQNIFSEPCKEWLNLTMEKTVNCLICLRIKSITSHVFFFFF